MYDIATSKYKQLQNIRNTHFSEVEASEEQKMEWKCPKKRMIQLKLTDGIQDIIGIEYKPMSTLNETLLPGYKVMIVGPVKCRRGVLLLEERKLRKIGGEVDSLLIPNALENILARALNVEENPDPYGDNELKSNNIEQREEPVNELANVFEDEFDINFDEVSEIENLHRKSPKQPNVNTMQIETVRENLLTNASIERTSNYSCTVQNERKNFNVNNDERKNDHTPSEDIILDDDDCFLEMVDEGQFVKPQTEQKMSAPFRALPKEEDDDLIIINDDDMVETKYGNMEKSVIKQDKTSRSNSSWFMNKTNSSKNASASTSRVKPTDTATPNIGAKRPVPMSPSDCAIKKKGRIDRKITEFTSSPPVVKLCDFIYDINNDIITEMTVKTICGRVEVLGKLSKQNTSWNLDATLVDGTGKIEVTFTNKVLEDLLGFSVQQFSLKKKLKKNPEIELELRTSFRNAERRIKTLHDLLELELDVNKKPTVIKIIDITQDKREQIEKQLQSFLKKNNI
ncbi:recQ-mediated genome instability protein 1 isoform X2 [Augochlora pura]